MNACSCRHGAAVFAEECAHGFDSAIHVFGDIVERDVACAGDLDEFLRLGCPVDELRRKRARQRRTAGREAYSRPTLVLPDTLSLAPGMDAGCVGFRQEEFPVKTRNIAIGVLAVIAARVVAFAIWFNSNLGVPPLEVGADASQTSRLEAVDAWLTGLHEAHKFNGGVLLAREGRPLLMKAYGVADHEGRVPLSTSSLFRLASVSKQFTAAGVLSLVESGGLELDQSVSTYLPGFPYPGVTVAHLLNMTSGIPDVYFELADIDAIVQELTMVLTAC